MTLPVPIQFPRAKEGAAPLALAAFTVVLSELKGMCFHLLRRTVLCVSVWLEMFLVSPPSVPLAHARLPHSQIAVPVLQGDAISMVGGTRTGLCSVGVVTTVPPVSARMGR